MRLIYTLLLAISFLTGNAQLKPTAYSDGSQKLNGLAGKPGKPLAGKPGVVVLPAWRGINKHAKTVAENLADEGYHTFVADIYGEANYPTTTEEAGKQSGYYKNNPDAYQRRIRLAIEQLVLSGADANSIAVIGYCFGGTGALEAARGQLPVKGVVSFHGGLSKNTARSNGPIAGKVLVLHGADDPHVPQKDIEAFQREMRDGKADWQMVYYANAVHAFTEKEAGSDNSKGVAYNEKADKRSWQHLLTFLKEVLQAR